MKRLRILIISVLLVLSMIIIVSNFILVSGNYVFTEAEQAVMFLNDLGICTDIYGENINLQKIPTCTDGIMIIARLLGADMETQSTEYEHPFTDVDSSIDKYVYYCWDKGLTKGVSATEFCPDERLTPEMYLTFILRALGYRDGENNDFMWDNPKNLAVYTGICDENIDSDVFTMADVIILTKNALKAEIKGEGKTLAEKLIEDGVFTQAQYDGNKETQTIEITTVSETQATLISTSETTVTTESEKSETVETTSSSNPGTDENETPIIIF